EVRTVVRGVAVRDPSLFPEGASRRPVGDPVAEADRRHAGEERGEDPAREPARDLVGPAEQLLAALVLERDAGPRLQVGELDLDPGLRGRVPRRGVPREADALLR